MTNRKKWRATWLKQLIQWHWISSALCLIGMFLFAITGVTLNHAGEIEARPKRSVQMKTAPPRLINVLSSQSAETNKDVPPDVQTWIREQFSVDISQRETEWSSRDLYVALPRPGGDGWISIDRGTGEARYEATDRGWVALFNDLHKGRHTGRAWSWFIDIFAGACIVFCATGLLLLQFHSVRRPATWPMLGLGFAIPFVLLVLIAH